MRKSIELKQDFKEQMKTKVRLSRKQKVSFNDILSTVKNHNPKGDQIEMLKKRWSLEAIQEVIKEENTKQIAIGDNNSESISDRLLRWIKG